MSFKIYSTYKLYNRFCSSRNPNTIHARVDNVTVLLIPIQTTIHSRHTYSNLALAIVTAASVLSQSLHVMNT